MVLNQATNSQYNKRCLSMQSDFPNFECGSEQDLMEME
jgi:hypothetical protein